MTDELWSTIQVRETVDMQMFIQKVLCSNLGRITGLSREFIIVGGGGGGFPFSWDEFRDGNIKHTTTVPIQILTYSPFVFPFHLTCFNLAPCHEGVLGSEDIVLISALDGGEWSASRPGRFTPREWVPGTLWTGGWMGLRAGLDTVAKRKIPSRCRDSKTRSSSP
jgi:hypothetical protein